jgi:MoxR-like ATPase
MSNWRVFSGDPTQKGVEESAWPDAPPWRQFNQSERDALKGTVFRPTPDVVDMVNLAIYLRRPLLVTGSPGVGKSSLAPAVAVRLGLDLLKWAINTSTTLLDGLYRYDALARLRDSQQGEQGRMRSTDVGRYIKLGPLGTAFYESAQHKPCVLLIDELDKGDIDLPNDLLNIFEEGEFEIPEVLRESDQRDPDAPLYVRDAQGKKIELKMQNGRIRCDEFPIVIMTSNGERDFPPAFMRRCLTVDVRAPKVEELVQIVRAHFGEELFLSYETQITKLINEFDEQRGGGMYATDQLLNLLHLVLNGRGASEEMKKLKDVLWRSLNQSS